MPIYNTGKKTKDGITKYRVFVSYTTASGDHKKASKIVCGLTEAKRVESEMLANTHEHEASTTLTVEALFDQYIESKRFQVRQTSLGKSIRTLKHHVLPHLGTIKVSKLNIRNLTEWKTKVDASGLAITSKQNVYGEFRAMLNYAVKMEYIPANPLPKVGNFKDTCFMQKSIDFYTPEEFEKYILAAYEDAVASDYYDYYVFFCIAYYSGARKGEINALKWTDIEDNILHITKSVAQKLKGDDVITPPKNKSSIRDVQLPSVLMNVLNEHYKRCHRYEGFNDDLYICGGPRPLRDTSLANKNIQFAKAAGLHRIRIHDFRHSHASLLINNNINVLEVSHRLGHSNIEMTLNTYSHFFPKEEDKALAVLDRIKC